ncbi:hypothetical protein QN224_13035 [Sinorhizobium sp. 8-89]|uniref:hypothetical protein n=1 Tax=Sinorhizobium sp. 7-81 TaxID=3049087 RepID=UPI0024C2B99E|nr:hypothetical protein [Sinorhizobium sp. 7-81]MDK1386333.1 hypothetical protein [Sinorhizobium sp. 7-81]
MTEYHTLRGAERSAVGVKELQWQTAASDYLRAGTPFGAYAITAFSGIDEPFRLQGLRMDTSYHATLDEAKAAAHRDYESRVRSALVLETGEAQRDRIDDLIERLLDAQQDINFAANCHMDQSLCDASALIDEVEAFLLLIRSSPPSLPAPDDLADMATVGNSLMNAIDTYTKAPSLIEDWLPADDPAEIVGDLYNRFEESINCHKADLDRLKAAEEKLQKAGEAIAYLLNRSQRDDKLYYQIGFGTEAFRLLTGAHAALTSDDVKAVEKRYGA